VFLEIGGERQLAAHAYVTPIDWTDRERETFRIIA
jgi:hypothetical protein